MPLFYVKMLKNYLICYPVVTRRNRCFHKVTDTLSGRMTCEKSDHRIEKSRDAKYVK